MTQKLTNDFPWLIFKLNNCKFSVNSQNVVSIIHLTKDITVAPHEQDFIKGLFTFRGAPIKLIDTRNLMNYKSTKQELEDFELMLEKRKEDHINWVNELTRCAVEHDEFKLATNPHECAFGKWYDSFQSNFEIINFHMRKIEEPHKLLHETALEVLKCQNECDNCERDECLKETLKRAKEEYMPEVLDLIEQAKKIFSTNYKEMIIVLNYEGQNFGVIVDEVVSVEDLIFLSTEDNKTASLRTQFVSSIAKTNKSEDLILILDLDQMVKVSN